MTNKSNHIKDRISAWLLFIIIVVLKLEVPICLHYYFPLTLFLSSFP